MSVGVECLDQLEAHLRSLSIQIQVVSILVDTQRWIRLCGFV